MLSLSAAAGIINHSSTIFITAKDDMAELAGGY
jgi:hypothetical protein